MEATGTKTINGYTFTTYSDGSVKAEGTLQNEQASRSGMSQITPAGYNSATDDKGHLIAARINGAADSANVFSQDRHTNRSTFSTIENQEAKLMEKGCTIQTDRTACVDQPGQEPTAFIINDTVTMPDGQTQVIHSYVDNFSPAEIAQQEAEAERLDEVNPLPYDDFNNPLPDGMSQEEYDAIMAEIDNDDEDTLSIQDDYDISKWSFSSLDSGSDNSSDNSTDDSTDDGTDDSSEPLKNGGHGTGMGV